MYSLAELQDVLSHSTLRRRLYASKVEPVRYPNLHARVCHSGSVLVHTRHHRRRLQNHPHRRSPLQTLEYHLENLVFLDAF